VCRFHFIIQIPVYFWQTKYGGEFGLPNFIPQIFSGQKFGGEFSYQRRLVSPLAA